MSLPLNDSPDESLAAPSLRFYYTDALHAKTLNLITTIEQAKDAARYRSQLADLVVELTNSGIDYYLLRPLKMANVGFVVEQSAVVGMSGAIRMLAGIIHNIIGRMNNDQLRFVCAYIRELMN